MDKILWLKTRPNSLVSTHFNGWIQFNLRQLLRVLSTIVLILILERFFKCWIPFALILWNSLQNQCVIPFVHPFSLLFGNLFLFYIWNPWMFPPLLSCFYQPLLLYHGTLDSLTSLVFIEIQPSFKGLHQVWKLIKRNFIIWKQMIESITKSVGKSVLNLLVVCLKEFGLLIQEQPITWLHFISS